MPANSQPLSELIADLDFASGEPLADSNQGEVRRFSLNGRELAIKQPKGRGLAWTIRAATLRHEFRAYQRLAGQSGFPKCHGLYGGKRLVLDFVDGTPIRRAELKNHEIFFARLLDIIQAMHASGVAHGDLKRKDNLLVDTAGHPVILDLGTATLKRDGNHPINARLFEFMRQTDLNAWVKLKYDGYENVSDSDAVMLKRTGIERWLARWRRG